MHRSPNRAHSSLHRRRHGAERPGPRAPIHRPSQASWHRGQRVPLALGQHIAAALTLRPLWIAATTAARAAALTCSWNADVTWISRQLLPAFVPLHALAKRPLVLDVDDAVWLNTGGHRARDLARACDLIVCGNTFLANNFSRWNSNVTVIPTAVNTAWYRPHPPRGSGGRQSHGMDRHQRQLSLPLRDRGSTPQSF